MEELGNRAHSNMNLNCENLMFELQVEHCAEDTQVR